VVVTEPTIAAGLSAELRARYADAASRISD
jgi:hypothetical protein